MWLAGVFQVAEHANPRWRESMEDAHVILDGFGSSPNKAVKGSNNGFFAIYDGHGGRSSSPFHVCFFEMIPE